MEINCKQAVSVRCNCVGKIGKKSSKSLLTLNRGADYIPPTTRAARRWRQSRSLLFISLREPRERHSAGSEPKAKDPRLRICDVRSLTIEYEKKEKRGRHGRAKSFELRLVGFIKRLWRTRFEREYVTIWLFSDSQVFTGSRRFKRDQIKPNQMS